MDAVILIHEAEEAGLPVVLGCPFQMEDGSEDNAVASAILADGNTVPVQCVALLPRNARGIQWQELSFLATARGEASIQLSQDEEKAEEIASTKGGDVILDNGLVRCTLNSDPASSPVLIGTPATEELAHFAPEVAVAGDDTHREDGNTPRQVKILRNGPVRAQAEVTGQLLTPAGKPSFSYRITIELWQGKSGVRLDWMLSHLVQGQQTIAVERATLKGTLNVGDNCTHRFTQRSHTNYYVPREVLNPGAVAIESNFECNSIVVSDAEMLLDDADYWGFLPTPTVATDEWLAITGEDAGMLVTIVDFAVSRPNRLRAEDNCLSYDLIPDGYPTNWPQGRRKEQSLLITPTAGNKNFDAKTANASAHALQREGRAVPAQGYLADLKCFDMDTVIPFETGRNVRISRFLNHLCVLKTPAEKWNLGDTIDSHYSRGYPGIPNRLEFKPGAPHMRPRWSTQGLLQAPEMEGLIEPVWTNNEYDVIHALAQESCRGGKPDNLRTLRWFSRHNIEVDFVALSDWSMHHRAMVAHSPHHNTTGAYPSHFWTQGLLQYYLLSGDRDALEVAIALGDKTIECLNDPEVCTLKFDREFGWGFLALVCLVEVTGIERFRKEADRIVDFLIAYDREGFAEKINLSAGDASKCMDRQIVECAFGYVGMIEAMDRYINASGRKDAEDWFCELLLSLKHHGWDKIDEGQWGAPNHMTHILAIGYERTGDEDFLQQCKVYLDAVFGPFANHSALFAANGETKPCASTYRALHRALGHADRAGMLRDYEYAALLERQEK